MNLPRIVLFATGVAVAAGALAAGAASLRAFGPDTGWNVFAAGPTSTATAMPTPTPTPSPTVTSTPTSTAAPAPTATPLPVAPDPSPPPVPGPEVLGERWIAIDLGAQTATAMLDGTPLYTAYVTTGKDGWNTPAGSFRILSRVENETMTSAAIGAEEYYVLKDVLYTQYFTDRGHALHLNYWRENYYFGNIRSSHGCVGMRLQDARFFWEYASLGTRVEIR